MLTFNEAISRGTGSIILINETGQVVETFTGSSNRITVSGTTLTINPTANLEAGHTYSVTIASGAVADTSGNSYAGLSSYSFSTPANQAPVVTGAGFSLLEDIALSATLPSATDPEGQAVTYALAQQAAHGTVAVNTNGSFVYTPASNYFGTDAFTYVASDGTKNSSAASISLSITAVIDHLMGTTNADTLVGNADADILQGLGGNDTLDGAGGIDTAQYTGARSHYVISHSGSAVIVQDNGGSDGTDTLRNIERLVFTDSNLALDLDGAAGITARVLGAVFGASAVSNKNFAGIGLSLMDQGLSYEQLMHLALGKMLGASPATAQVVDLLYTNVVGTAPSAANGAYFVSLVDSGALTIDRLGMLAADNKLNTSQIDLVGLADHGLDYLPFG